MTQLLPQRAYTLNYMGAEALRGEVTHPRSFRRSVAELVSKPLLDQATSEAERGQELSEPRMQNNPLSPESVGIAFKVTLRNTEWETLAHHSVMCMPSTNAFFHKHCAWNPITWEGFRTIFPQSDHRAGDC